MKYFMEKMKYFMEKMKYFMENMKYFMENMKSFIEKISTSWIRWRKRVKSQQKEEQQFSNL